MLVQFGPLGPPYVPGSCSHRDVGHSLAALCGGVVVLWREDTPFRVQPDKPTIADLGCPACALVFPPLAALVLASVKAKAEATAAADLAMIAGGLANNQADLATPQARGAARAYANTSHADTTRR